MYRILFVTEKSFTGISSYRPRRIRRFFGDDEIYVQSIGIIDKNSLCNLYELYLCIHQLLYDGEFPFSFKRCSLNIIVSIFYKRTTLTGYCDGCNENTPVWIEPQVGYRIKPSIDYLRTSDEAPALLSQLTLRARDIASIVAPAIPQEYLTSEAQTIETIDHTGIKNSFLAQSSDLHTFIFRYDFHREVSQMERMLLFCQLAAEFSDQMDFTGDMAVSDSYRYMTIYPLRN